MQTKITHLTSAHDRYDIRIFVKMCCSLAMNSDYKVSLVVADGNGDEIKKNVHIFDSGAKPLGRITRMTSTVNQVYRKAVELNSDIYHLHDPELIPIGMLLKRLGKKVIFDAHEDLPKQLLGKPYLNRFMKLVLSNLFVLIEKLTCRSFDYIITATPFIRDKFIAINKKTIDINNFPILGELSKEGSWQMKRNEVCYVGGIAQIRGIKEVIAAMEFTDNVRLNLVGPFSEKEVEEEVKTYAGWKNVNQLGTLDRESVAEIMAQSKAGLVIFHPLPNHIDAQPNKMFEYMSAGLPLVTSNFPFWREIVELNNCGLTVDPLRPMEIAAAINTLVHNPKVAERMGENGKRAVLEKYNWGAEEIKLFRVYNELTT